MTQYILIRGYAHQMNDASIQKLLQDRPKLEKLCADLNIKKPLSKIPKTKPKKSVSNPMLDSLCVSGRKSKSKDKIKDIADRPIEESDAKCSPLIDERASNPSSFKKVTEHTKRDAGDRKDVDVEHSKDGPPKELLRFQIKPTAMMIFGPPGRGKSYLLKKMFLNPPTDPNNVDPKTGIEQPAIQMIVIFTPTFKDWEDVPEARKCLRSWSIDSIRSLMQYQYNSGGKHHVAVILDDILAVINFDDKLMIELFTRHRHYNMSIVISAQNITKTIHKIIRNMISIFVTFDLPSLESSDAVYKAFGADVWPSINAMFRDIKSLNLRETHSYVIIRVGEPGYSVGCESNEEGG